MTTSSFELADRHHFTSDSFDHSSSPSLDEDFPLYTTCDEDQDHVASVHVSKPLDLSIIGSFGENGLSQDSGRSTPYDQSFSTASKQRFTLPASSPHPRFRVQQYTPDTPSSIATPPPMHEGGNWAQASWANQQDQAYLSPTSSTHIYNTPPQAWRGHKRLSSGSSVASTGPDSPFTQTSSYPQIVDTETQLASSPHIDSFDPSSFQASAQFDKPLFYTPTATFNPLSFVNPSFQSLNLSDNNARSIMARHNTQGGDMVSQNGSGMNAPAQPASRLYGAFQNFSGSTSVTGSTPKFERTESDVYQDELYDTSQATPSTRNVPQSSHAYNHGPNHGSMFNTRLQQAQEARSLTPASDLPRQRSPFYDGSDYGHGNFSQVPSNTGASRTVARLRQEQKMQEDDRVYAQHHSVQSAAGLAPPTISPKEAVLDYHGPAGAQPTTVKHEPSAYAARSASVNAANSHNFNHQHDYAGTSINRRTGPASSSSQQSVPSNGYSYMPSNNGTSGTSLPSYPFIQQRRQSSSLRSEQSDLPPFPATLTSFESTKSESSREPNVRPTAFRATEQPSSQRSDGSSPRQRPADTSARSNTYTCTESKCNARFENAAKMQKHKRENHRTSVHPASPTVSVSSSSRGHNSQAAANNASRNNAPGPHRCERINPSTGRPCSTVFSRSYDLTRHEETIHNGDKKKARCNLCQEEKLFSRNDALTRHMRVVHPDVDYPPTRNRRR